MKTMWHCKIELNNDIKKKFSLKGRKKIPMTSENETFDWLSNSRCSGFGDIFDNLEGNR